MLISRGTQTDKCNKAGWLPDCSLSNQSVGCQSRSWAGLLQKELNSISSSPAKNVPQTTCNRHHFINNDQLQLYQLWRNSATMFSVTYEIPGLYTCLFFLLCRLSAVTHKEGETPPPVCGQNSVFVPSAFDGKTLRTKLPNTKYEGFS